MRFRRNSKPKLILEQLTTVLSEYVRNLSVSTDFVRSRFLPYCFLIVCLSCFSAVHYLVVFFSWNQPCNYSINNSWSTFLPVSKNSGLPAPYHYIFAVTYKILVYRFANKISLLLTHIWAPCLEYPFPCKNFDQLKNFNLRKKLTLVKNLPHTKSLTHVKRFYLHKKVHPRTPHWTHVTQRTHATQKPTKRT